MDSAVRACLTLFVAASWLTGCLDNPMNPGGDNVGTNTGTNGVADAGSACADCTIGESRCDEREDGQTVHQTCVGELDEGGAECPFWETQELCEGSQTCSAADGCQCSSTCTPGERECKPGGVFVCMMIDGCPSEVNVCRNSSCDAPSSDASLDCDEDSDNPFCQPCGGSAGSPNNGRQCVLACPDVNDCYSCG